MTRVCSSDYIIASGDKTVMSKYFPEKLSFLELMHARQYTQMLVKHQIVEYDRLGLLYKDWDFGYDSKILSVSGAPELEIWYLNGFEQYLASKHIILYIALEQGAELYDSDFMSQTMTRTKSFIS